MEAKSLLEAAALAQLLEQELGLELALLWAQQLEVGLGSQLVQELARLLEVRSHLVEEAWAPQLAQVLGLLLEAKSLPEAAALAQLWEPQLGLELALLWALVLALASGRASAPK